MVFLVAPRYQMPSPLHFCSYKHVFQRFTSFVGYDRRDGELSKKLATRYAERGIKIIWSWFEQSNLSIEEIIKFTYSPGGVKDYSSVK